MPRRPTVLLQRPRGIVRPSRQRLGAARSEFSPALDAVADPCRIRARGAAQRLKPRHDVASAHRRPPLRPQPHRLRAHPVRSHHPRRPRPGRARWGRCSLRWGLASGHGGWHPCTRPGPDLALRRGPRRRGRQVRSPFARELAPPGGRYPPAPASRSFLSICRTAMWVLAAATSPAWLLPGAVVLGLEWTTFAAAHAGCAAGSSCARSPIQPHRRPPYADRWPRRVTGRRRRWNSPACCR